MASEFDKFVLVASKVARDAGKHIVRNLGALKSGDVGQKQTADFVTRVDRESEEIIVGKIRDEFPGHTFLAEEGGSYGNPSEGDVFRWIVDPLDGTTNFIHTYPVFAVSIALEHNGSIVAGVVYDPLRDELFHATLGGGAFLGERRLSVSSYEELSSCLLTTGFPFKQKDMLPRYMDLFSALFRQVSGIRRAGAAAIDLAYLAAGRCDGFFELGLSPWDIAAGSLLITEAGGIITDFSGGSEYLRTGNVLAGNSLVHPVLCREAESVFEGIVDK